MTISAAAVQGGGLTFRDMLADIPHDVPAMVVYAMLLLFAGFIWWGSRNRDEAGASGSGTGGTESPPRSPEHPAD